ncbi:unnamed protein product, partial [Lampetra planeri]
MATDCDGATLGRHLTFAAADVEEKRKGLWERGYASGAGLTGWVALPERRVRKPSMSNAKGSQRPMSVPRARPSETTCRRSTLLSATVGPGNPFPPRGGQGHRGPADGKSETESSPLSSNGSDVSVAAPGMFSKSPVLSGRKAKPDLVVKLQGDRGEPGGGGTATGLRKMGTNDGSFATPVRRNNSVLVRNDTSSRSTPSGVREAGAMRPQGCAGPQGVRLDALLHNTGGDPCVVEEEEAARAHGAGYDHFNRVLLSDIVVGCGRDLKLSGSCGARIGAAAVGEGRKPLENANGGHLQEHTIFSQDCTLETEDELLGCKPLGSYEDLYRGDKMQSNTTFFSCPGTHCVNFHVENALDGNLCCCEDDTGTSKFIAQPKCVAPQNHTSNPSALTPRAIKSSSPIARAVPPCKTPMAFSPVLGCFHRGPVGTDAMQKEIPLLGTAQQRVQRQPSVDEINAELLRGPACDSFAYNSCIKKDCVAIVNEIRKRNLQKWESLNSSADNPLRCLTLNETSNIVREMYECSPMQSMLPRKNAKVLDLIAERQQANQAAASEQQKFMLWLNATALPALEHGALDEAMCALGRAEDAASSTGRAAEVVAVENMAVNVTKELSLPDIDSTMMTVASQDLNSAVTSLPTAMVENKLVDTKRPKGFGVLPKAGCENGPLCINDPKRAQIGAPLGSDINHRRIPGDHGMLKYKHSPNGPSDLQKVSLNGRTTSTPLVDDGCARTLVPAVMFAGDNDLGEISTISSSSKSSFNGLPQQFNFDKGTLPVSINRRAESTAVKASKKTLTGRGVTTDDQTSNAKKLPTVVRKAWSLDVMQKKLQMSNPNKSMERIPATVVEGRVARATVTNVQKFKHPVKATDPTGRRMAGVDAPGELLPSKVKASAVMQPRDNSAAAIKARGLPTFPRRALPSSLCLTKLLAAGPTKYGSPTRPRQQVIDGVARKLTNTPSKPGSSSKLCTPVKAGVTAAAAGRRTVAAVTPQKPSKVLGCPHLDGDGPSVLGAVNMSPKVPLANAVRPSPRAMKPPMRLPARASAPAQAPNVVVSAQRRQLNGPGDGHSEKGAPSSGQVRARQLKPPFGSKLRAPTRPTHGDKAEPPAPVRDAVDGVPLEEAAVGSANLTMIQVDDGRDSSKVAAGCLLQPSNGSLRPTGPFSSAGRGRPTAMRPPSFLPGCRGASRLPATRATVAARPQPDNPNSTFFAAATDFSAQLCQKLLALPALRKRSPSPGSASVASTQSTDSDRSGHAAHRGAKRGPPSQVSASATISNGDTPEGRYASVTGAGRPALSGCLSQPDLLLSRGPDELLGELRATRDELARRLRCAQRLDAERVTALAALATALQHLAAKNEKSSGKLTDLNLDLKSVQQQLAIYVERCTRLEQEKEAAERDAVAAVAALAEAERRHAEALSNLEATLRQQFDGEMEQLQQTHEQELDARVAQVPGHAPPMSTIGYVQMMRLKSYVEFFNKSSHCLAPCRLFPELNQSFESERTSMQNKFEREKSCLEETVKTLSMQIKTQKEEISSIGKLLKNTSASKSPASSPHMEDELNSLKAVVDIRTQQIHTLERRMLTLQQEADAKRIVEEKLQVLQQQNEDMKARMDKSMEVTRQLSSEQTALQASLQREAKAKQRLSMEKEQLMWKLQNGSSPGPLPTPPTHPTPYPAPPSPPSPSTPSPLHP